MLPLKFHQTNRFKNMKKNLSFSALLLCVFFILNAFVDIKSPFKQNRKKVNLIFQSFDPSTIYETDWIREILSELEVKEIHDKNYEIFEDHSIIVLSEIDKEKLNNYIDKLQKLNYKFGVIHISDELYQAPTDFYGKCSFVIRNYWHKNFLNQKNVHFFPLGYKQGFWRDFPKTEIKDSGHRKYTWSFAGQVAKSTRMSMINQMKTIPNYFFYEIFSFNAANSLKPGDYRDVLLDSIFVPCPRGWWNLDSFRVSEALECGCIPIVERTPFDYFEKFYGKYPFISVESWDGVPELINALRSDPLRLEQLRLECYQWWVKYKKEMKSQITDVVNTSFEEEKSTAIQNQYQFTLDPIDVVIPCDAKDQEILETCIEGIKSNCKQIRRVIVVSPEKLTDHAEWFDEKKYPFDKFKISIHLLPKDVEVSQEFRSQANARTGWYYQQLLKLYAAFVIPDISPNILILDADSIFLNPITFMDFEGKGLYNTASENHLPYFVHAEKLIPGLKKQHPGVSGITHHMLFQKCIVQDLFKVVEQAHGKEFWKAFCECVDRADVCYSGASEYEIYFNFLFSKTKHAKMRRLKHLNAREVEQISTLKAQGYTYVSYHSYERISL